MVLAGDTVGCLYLIVPRNFIKKFVTDDWGKVLTHWNYAEKMRLACLIGTRGTWRENWNVRKQKGKFLLLLLTYLLIGEVFFLH